MLQRIPRNEDRSETQRSTFFFTPFFFSGLLAKDPHEVRHFYVKKKTFKVFETKMIFVPVHHASHWSLCCIVNPGLIANYTASSNETLEASYIIQLDSFRGAKCSHDKLDVPAKLRKWLNYEWRQQHLTEHSHDPFNETSMPSLYPEGNAPRVMFY